MGRRKGEGEEVNVQSESGHLHSFENSLSFFFLYVYVCVCVCVCACLWPEKSHHLVFISTIFSLILDQPPSPEINEIKCLCFKLYERGTNQASRTKGNITGRSDGS